MVEIRMEKISVVCLLALLGGWTAPAATDRLADAFQSPPAEARPRCWWHWMSNFVPENGITKDLEAMKRVDVGGATILDICEVSAHSA